MLTITDKGGRGGQANADKADKGGGRVVGQMLTITDKGG